MTASLLERLAAAVQVIAGVLLVFVALAMVATITGRYVGFPTAWADEAARIAFVWSACLGAASGLHRGLHFTVRLFRLDDDGLAGRAFETAIALLVIVLCAAVLWATTASIPVVMKARLPALGVTGAWFHSAISAFAVLSVLFMSGHLARGWRVR